jgi:hypothetical protein
MKCELAIIIIIIIIISDFVSKGLGKCVHHFVSLGKMSLALKRGPPSLESFESWHERANKLLFSFIITQVGHIIQRAFCGFLLVVGFLCLWVCSRIVRATKMSYRWVRVYVVSSSSSCEEGLEKRNSCCPDIIRVECRSVCCCTPQHYCEWCMIIRVCDDSSKRNSVSSATIHSKIDYYNPSVIIIIIIYAVMLMLMRLTAL